MIRSLVLLLLVLLPCAPGSAQSFEPVRQLQVRDSHDRFLGILLPTQLGSREYVEGLVPVARGKDFLVLHLRQRRFSISLLTGSSKLYFASHNCTGQPFVDAPTYRDPSVSAVAGARIYVPRPDTLWVLLAPQSTREWACHRDSPGPRRLRPAMLWFDLTTEFTPPFHVVPAP